MRGFFGMWKKIKIINLKENKIWFRGRILGLIRGIENMVMLYK